MRPPSDSPNELNTPRSPEPVAGAIASPSGPPFRPGIAAGSTVAVAVPVLKLTRYTRPFVDPCVIQTWPPLFSTARSPTDPDARPLIVVLIGLMRTRLPAAAGAARRNGRIVTSEVVLFMGIPWGRSGCGVRAPLVSAARPVLSRPPRIPRKSAAGARSSGPAALGAVRNPEDPTRRCGDEASRVP